jgi:hypothetical protein
MVRSVDMEPDARTLVALFVAVMLVVLASGCGRGETDVDASAPPAPPGTAEITRWEPGAELPEGWTTKIAEVEAMRVSDGGQALLVDAVLHPVRLPDASCAAGVGGRLNDDDHPEVVWASVSVAVPSVSDDEAVATAAGQHGDCAPVTSTVDLAVTGPIGNRDVMVDRTRWANGGDGTFARCEPPDCDPTTGAEPVSASCDDHGALVDDVRTFGDTGRHARILEVRCEGAYAMVEVDIGAGACGPTDGEPNTCAGTRIDRLFLRAGTPHWGVVTRTREAGCGDVVALVPDYPVALCEDRPAVGGD